MVVVRLRQFILTLFLLAATNLIIAPSAQATNQDYLAYLIQQAQDKQLQQRPEWRKLLHYKAGLLPNSFKSQVDAPEFFLAERGKTDPQAELEATLAAFFQALPRDRDVQHLNPQCRFVARYQWLSQQLNFDPTRLPKYDCWRFDEWMAALNPQGLTLIFPTAYINSPASMFGHTLIRVDAHDQNEQTRLLAYAINFGADTGNDGGLAYAVKGLLGGYPGGFSVQPYYLKVREYSDMENRDIWEYQLDLTETEVHTMLLHAWELRGIWFDYFFFDENCSYHLLSLIETTRPELQLTDQFGAWAIPSDTVRVLDEAGLIKQTHYRPSRHAVLQQRMANLPTNQIHAIQQLAQAKLAPNNDLITNMPTAMQAETLELAHEYADYHQDDNQQQLHQLLQARSQLNIISPNITVPGGTRPEQGHGTGRSSLSLGREDRRNYQELQLRPAYHDLLDPAPGYANGAQIAFFSLGLRYDNDADTARLQYFTPVDIVSLTPVSDISRPISWQFDFGLRRKHGQDRNRMISSINGGAGQSWSLGKNGVAYTLLNLGIDISEQALRKGYAAGIGGSAGLLIEQGVNWSAHLFAKTINYSAGNKHNEKNIGLEQRYTTSKSDTIRMQWTRQRQLGNAFSNFNISWQHFF